MATQFNVDLPPRFVYDKKKPTTETVEDITSYLERLITSLEEAYKKLFVRVAEVVDTPTKDNLPKLDVDGQIVDSGVEVGAIAVNAASIATNAADIATIIATARHQSSQAVGSTSGPTTASTTYVDLEEMSVTITTGAHPVLVLFNGTFLNDADSSVYVIIDVDGTDEGETERLHVGASQGDVIATSWLGTVSASEHIFKVQWRVNAGTGTAYLVERVMQVIELK